MVTSNEEMKALNSKITELQEHNQNLVDANKTLIHEYMDSWGKVDESNNWSWNSMNFPQWQLKLLIWPFKLTDKDGIQTNDVALQICDSTTNNRDEASKNAEPYHPQSYDAVFYHSEDQINSYSNDGMMIDTLLENGLICNRRKVL